jgi:hypothetical protein
MRVSIASSAITLVDNKAGQLTDVMDTIPPALLGRADVVIE